jgi:hypothetical protein
MGVNPGLPGAGGATGDAVGGPPPPERGRRASRAETGQLRHAGGGFAAKMLSAARALVAHGCCRHDAALNEEGEPVQPWSALARRWSIPGALVTVRQEWRRINGPADDVSRGFERALLSLQAVLGDVSLWTDVPGRRQQEVLAAFERALELLRRTR